MNHRMTINLPGARWEVAEVIRAAVRGAQVGAPTELRPAAVGEGWEVLGWAEAGSQTAAAANWAAVVAAILRDCGHLFPLPTDRGNPRVKVGKVVRRATAPGGPLPIEAGISGLRQWRDCYALP